MKETFLISLIFVLAACATTVAERKKCVRAVRQVPEASNGEKPACVQEVQLPAYPVSVSELLR